MIKYLLLIVFTAPLLHSCSNNLEDRMDKYLKAKLQRDGSHLNYVSDTLKIWLEDKSKEPRLRIKGQSSGGPWADWDKVFHSYSWADSVTVNAKGRSTIGTFYESNEFYDLIGKPPTRSTRTFWFDKNDEIDEILIVWEPGQKTSDQYLKPIVEWAMLNAPAEIEAIYPNGSIKPSDQNAKRWRLLIESYRASN